MVNPSFKNHRHHSQSLWLCLFFFDLPFDVLSTDRSKNENADSEAVAVIVEKNRVTFTNAAARDAGIQAGMRLATVYALVPTAVIHARDLAAENQVLEQLAHWCYRFTPTVAVEKNFCLSLEIGGSLKLFHGLQPLLRQITTSLQQLGYSVRPGLGHSPLVAWLFSQSQQMLINLEALNENQKLNKDFFIDPLRTLSLTYLALPEKQLQQLLNLGLRHIGDLLDLPAPSLGKRYGKDFVALIKAIKGEELTLRSDWQAPVRFEQSLDFAGGLTRVDELIEPIRQLLAEFSQFLLTHHYHPQAFRWHFLYFNTTLTKTTLRNKNNDVLTLSLASSDHSFKHLLAMTRLKLEKFQIQAPVESLKLSCDQFIKAAPSSGDLFPEISRPEAQWQNYRLLLDKLHSRLGDNSLYCLQLHDEHLPDNKQTVTALTPSALTATALTAKKSSQYTPTPAREPLWLLPQPLAIRERNNALNYQGPLEIVYRLQRIDNLWWQQRQQRDYFIAKHSSGIHYWVFKDLTTQQWFVQGLFG